MLVFPTDRSPGAPPAADAPPCASGAPARPAAPRPTAPDEAVFRQFVEHAPAALAMFDRELRFLAVSRRWLDQHGPRGVAPDDVVGRMYDDVSPGVGERWRACHERVLAGAEECVDDECAAGPDGVVRQLRYELRPWFAADGAAGGTIVLAEATAARRAAEAALRDSELRFRALAETATDAIVSADARGDIVFWNRGAERIFGYTEAEALGRSLTLLMPAASHAAHSRGLARLAAGGPPRLAGRVVEVGAVRKSGEAFPIELAMTPYTVDGEVRITSIMRDVSDRRRAQRAQAEQHALLAAVLDGTTDAMWVKDAAGVYQLINRAGAAMLGREVAAIVGRIEQELLAAESARAACDRDAAVLESGVTRTEETESTTVDGVRRAYLTTRAPLRDAEGRAVGVIGVSRDITTRRRAEAALREGEARLRLALDAAGMVAWEYEAAPGEAHRDFLAEVHPDDRARAAAAWSAAVEGDGGGELHVEYRTPAGVDPDGEPGWRVARGRVVRDADGRPQRLHGVTMDVTERRRHEAARAREARLGLLTTQLPAMLWSVDAELRITSSTGAGFAAVGLAPSQVVGLPLREYLGTDDPDAPPLAAVRQALGGRSATYAADVGARTFETHVEPLRDAAGDIVGALGLAIDITDRCRLEEQLARQAFTDALTGLANRALFHDRVAHALSRRAGGRDGEHVGVLFLDLDDFKSVNDSLGHPQGDALLQEVATRLRRATRGCDTVARLGGDEFAVLLEGMVDAGGGAPVVRRIEAALRAPVRLGDGAAAREWRVRASIGVAYAGAGDAADELLRNADVAMYAAKAAGRARHAVFEPAMHAAVLARLELEADLRRAVAALDAPGAPEGAPEGAPPDAAAGARPGFRLVYQPIVDLADGRVVAVEALARWTRPDGRVVSPAEFVPIAESTGLVVPLGRWVLREACARAAGWRAAGGAASALRVAVNVSGRQLADSAALAADVAAALARSGLAAEGLTLEMTESVLMQRTDETLERLHALKALGVRLAVDDFGTGYSSLAYLQRFPVDVLKIDKAFVDGVADEPGDRAIARTVVALGQSLGLRTVAEGVETEAQRRTLAALGCDHAQGYLFARPLEAERVAAAVGAAAAPTAGHA